MFDLTLFSLHLTAGRELPDLPGFLTATQPRRPERHRAGEQLVALFTTPNGQLLPDEFTAEMMQILSNKYYSTGGTVTSAIRTAVDQLNSALLKRTSLATEKSTTGLVLNLAVIHHNLVYIAQAGSTHTFVLGKTNVDDFTDFQGAGRALGLSQSFNLRFYQAEIQPGDLLLFCAEPPAAWVPAALIEGSQVGPEVLRRRLFNQSPPELRAGLVQLLEGTGQVRSWRPGTANTLARPAVPAANGNRPAVSPTPLTPSSPQPDRPAPVRASESSARPSATRVAAQPTAPVAEPLESVRTDSLLAEDRPTAATTGKARRERSSQPARQAQPEKDHKGFFSRIFQPKPTRQAGAIAEIALEQEIPTVSDEPAVPIQKRRPWLKRFANVLRGVRTARQKTGRSVGGFLPRLVPGTNSQSLSPSPATMFFIALAVPVMVVAVGTTVYLRSGASEQRAAYLQQAQAYADQAGKQKDLAQRRSSWTQVVYWSKKAEEFGSDDTTQSLRRKAQLALDSMDGIVRLSLAPAFTGILSNQINISRMAATASDLYLLDSNQGRIMHMFLSGRSYEYDPNFTCGPGPSGGKIVGPLVGLSTLPLNNDYKASVLAIDGAGNLLYCVNGASALVTTLSPPDNNWGKIAGMALVNGNLFVLDIQNNAVWRFDGNSYNFSGRPRLFFGNEVPNLANVVDLTVYQDDLYLLRSDGKMTVCTYSSFEFSPTRCNDPTAYGTRTGPAKSIAGTNFLQLQTTQPPDPSLFMVDSKGPAIYHFSLRLNYQRQLRQDPESDFPLPQKPVTAFTIGPARVIYLAFSNQIYYGAIP